MPKVSIIVPVHNLELVIRQCVDSIIAQTLQDIEIILIDDESTDRSPAICDEYADKDSRIHVIHQKNMGLSGVRNKGIEVSSSPYFMIVDGDDWLEKNAAEILYEKAIEWKSDILMCSYFANTQNEEKKDSFFCVPEFHYSTKNEMLILQEDCISTNHISNLRAASNMGVTWARIYRRDFILDNNLRFVVGLKRTQDAIFHLYALEVASKVDFMDIPLHHYRIWPASASKRASKDFHLTAEQIINHIAEFMRISKKTESLQDAYNAKTVKLLLEIVKLELAPNSNSATFQRKRRALKQLAEKSPYDKALGVVKTDGFTKGQKAGCMLLKMKMYGALILLYSLKENA